MDLVKIGFLIKADGLVKANKEIDALLAKADKLNNLGGAGGGTGSGSGGKQRNQNKPAKEIDKTTKALEKQKIIGDYVSQGLDKSTATTLANFKQLGASTKDLNKMFAQLGNIKSLEQANKAVKDLAKAQKQAQKDIEKQEKAIESTRQKRLSAEQKEYQKTQEQAKKSIKQQEQQLEASRQKKLSAEQKAYQKTQEDAKKLQQKQQDLANKAQQNADNLRQKTLAAEQKYYQKVQEEARKAAAKQQELSNKNVAAAEAARQKSLASAQKEYQKNMELIQKQQQAQRAAQQKADEAQEKARQKKFSAEQKYYQQQQELAAKAARTQQDSINRQNQQRQNAVKQEETKAKYLGQGFSQTASTRLARMELSGADVATMERYKQALRDTAKAMNDMRPPAAAATEGNNRLLASIRGIAAYALLSTAIYGVITGVAALAKAMVTMSDEYTSIQNRMKLYVTDAQELTKVNAQLAQFSIANNVGLRETATLFSRLQPAMQKIGANTAAVTSVVDAFGKSLRIGGATATEAASATIQFSQAMASGKLAGDEFRSISEASPRFLQAIAEGSGIAADQLKKMSAAGMLTTEVISKALLKEYPKLIEENKKLGITLEQGANALKTGFLVAFGEFNEGAGITKALGESMANLAQSMLTAAQGARQFGADINKWFKDNANTIQTVVEVIKLLAVTIVSKYVASMIVAGAISLKTAYSMNIAALGATALQRTFGVAAIASLRLGSALASLATPTNLFTLGLTVAGVAATYFLLRDNAAEANAKLVEQSDIVRMTKEEVEALTNAQKENLKVKITIDMKEANKNIDEAEAKYLSMMNVLTGKQFGNTLPSSAEKLISQVADGTKAFDDVTVSLLNMGVISEKSAKQLFDQTGVIVTAKQEALKYGNNARLLGTDLEITGNKAHNATPAIAGFKSEVQGVGDKAEIAGGKVRKFYQDLQADTKKNILAFDLTNKLNISPSTANKVADELSGRAAQEEGLKNKELINQKQKLVKLNADLIAQNAGFQKGAKSREELDQLKANTAEVLKQKRIYDNMLKSNPYVKVSPSSLLTEEDKKTIKAYDASTSLSSNQTKADKEADKARKKQEADAQRAANANQKIVDKYDNQEAIAIRLNEYLKAGVAYSVAKVASEGKYAKVYGDNLETARKIAKARQEVADIEESSKGREDSQNSLKKQFGDHLAIVDFMKEGYSYAVAQATVQSGFAVNAEGIANANDRTLISLHEQLIASEADIIYQQDLLDFVKSGLSVEEASAQVAIYRNKHLNQGLIITAEELAKAKQIEQVTKSQLALEQESNSYKEQATYLVQTTKNELADIMAQYKGVSLQEAQTLQTRKDIVEKLREYNDLLEKQKSLSGVLDSTNFEVFGDFGNPFKSALEGLNSLLFGMSDLEAKYQRMGADLTARIDKEKEGSKAQKLLIAEKADLELMHIQDSKQARDKAITSGLSLTKSMFKEESKGYKVVSALEKVYQAQKIAFALWEKKDEIQKFALRVVSYAKEGAVFLASTALKTAAQMGFNVVAAQGAVASAAQAPPPVGFASAAAMIALLAGVGIAISGGSSGSFAPANDGTGTVFGDSTAKSESINNSIELLSENSDLMLPLTSAMLRSLRNIESSLGGVANLIIRGDVGNIAGGLTYADKLTGVVGTVNKISTDSSKIMMNVLTLGLDKLLLGGALGDLAGGIVSTVLGGLFGKTSAEVTGSGLFGDAQSLGNVMDGGFNLSEYADITTTKKSWFSKKTSYSTKYQAASKELSDQFGLIFTNVYDSILSASSVLGRDENDVIQKLRGSIINIGKIDTKGKTGEEIQEALESVIGQQSDLIAKGAVGGLEDFQKVGEGYFETLMRVATGIETASYFTDRLNVTAIKYNDIINKQGDVAAEMVRQSVLLVEGNKNINGGFYDLVNTFDGTAEEITDFVFTLRDLQDQLFMTGKNADYLTSSMILGAGGLDSLASGLDAYFEMLSPAEQAAELTRRLTNEFAIFGKELPANVRAYRDLVNSITDTELATEAGQKLYGQIIALAPEFNDLQDSIKSANSEVNALVQSLRDLAEQARAARGETEQPRNLAYTRSQFEQASVLAMQGDIASAEKLLTLGNDLMGLSKTYSVSGSEYARDLALIQRAATVSADIQAQGLGTSISTTLTPSSGSTTTPTVNTNTTSTDAKLDALSEKLEAGLFAIAKYTQDSASRLERWDDGGRMMVGIQPENGDTPVPVVVTP